MKQDDSLTLDKAYSELQQIVDEVEKGDVNLETSVAKYKTGYELATFLKTKLSDIKVEIEEIKEKTEARKI